MDFWAIGPKGFLPGAASAVIAEACSGEGQVPSDLLGASVDGEFLAGSCVSGAWRSAHLADDGTQSGQLLIASSIPKQGE